MNDNINFLESLNQGFKRTIFWNKYISETTTQSKNKNLDYMIDPTFRSFNSLFVLPFNFNAIGNVDFPRRKFLISIICH